jgi:hypothetical protein
MKPWPAFSSAIGLANSQATLYMLLFFTFILKVVVVYLNKTKADEEPDILTAAKKVYNMQSLL